MSDHFRSGTQAQIGKLADWLTDDGGDIERTAW